MRPDCETCVDFMSCGYDEVRHRYTGTGPDCYTPKDTVKDVFSEYVEEQKPEDGIYMELFAVKNGVRYNAKIINMRDVSTVLTGSLMDGIKKLWEE